LNSCKKPVITEKITIPERGKAKFDGDGFSK
jgi:hypothetical protein